MRRLAHHQDVDLPVRIQGALSDHAPHEVRFSPAEFGGDDRQPLRMPQAVAIVASVDLARALAADPATRPDGFVLEGPTAGGHNAPPRGPRRVDELDQPIYDQRDVIDLPEVAALGLPFWLAGSRATPHGLRQAVQAGATGVQVGTSFAFCQESGFSPDIKQQVLSDVAAGTVAVRSDWRASPTGFPFRVVDVPFTLSDRTVAEDRQAVCDLGVLRSAYLTPTGTVDYRCPAEPVASYVSRKGGRETTTRGRLCLCNALLASAGLPQRRRGGRAEPALVTAGSDFATVAHLLEHAPPGQRSYSAADVVTYLLGEMPDRPAPQDG